MMVIIGFLLLYYVAYFILSEFDLIKSSLDLVRRKKSFYSVFNTMSMKIKIQMEREIKDPTTNIFRI